MKRTFTYNDGKSDKFWAIETASDATTFTVTYGKTGTAGQTLAKDFPTADAARKAAEKLIAEKTSKGYVEQGSEQSNASSTPSAAACFKRIPADMPKRPVSIKHAGPITNLVALKDGGFCAADKASDKEANITFYNFDGTVRGSHQFTRILQIEVLASGIYVCDNESVYVLDAYGKVLRELKPCIKRLFTVLADGRIIYRGSDMRTLLQITNENETKEFRKFDADLLKGLPFMDARGNVAYVVPSGDDYPFQFLSPTGETKWTVTPKPPFYWPLSEHTNGRWTTASETGIYVINPEQQTCVHIPYDNIQAKRTCPVGDDHVASAPGKGVVEIMSLNQTSKISVRIDPYGSDNPLLSAGNQHELFVTSVSSKIYRIAPDGSCTGVCALANAPGEACKMAVITNGTLAISDTANCISLLSPETFGKGELSPEPVFLTKRAAELEKHFAPWAATKACKTIIKDVLGRLTADRSKDSALELDFLTTSGETLTIKFGPPSPGKAPANFPESYRKATELHGSVQFDTGDGAGFYWSGDGEGNFDMHYDDYDFEPDKKGLYGSNKERYAEIALGGQNCFIFDRGRTNKLGEPLILLFDHGGDFESANTFDAESQKKTAYGIPGFIFRVIGFCLFEDDPRFEDCDMG